MIDKLFQSFLPFSDISLFVKSENRWRVVHRIGELLVSEWWLPPPSHDATGQANIPQQPQHNFQTQPQQHIDGRHASAGAATCAAAVASSCRCSLVRPSSSSRGEFLIHPSIRLSRSDVWNGILTRTEYIANKWYTLSWGKTRLVRCSRKSETCPKYPYSALYRL